MSIIFTVVGLAMCVGLAIVENKKSGSDKFEFDWSKLLESWTEFAGDGFQSIIKWVVKSIQKGIQNKRLSAEINSITQEDADRFQTILKEIKENDKGCFENRNNKNWIEKIKQAFEKAFRNKKNADLKAIADVSNVILWEYDYKTYLTKYSKTFAGLGDGQEMFLDLINAVIEVYRKDVFAKTDEQTKVMASIIVESLKQFATQFATELEIKTENGVLVDEDILNKLNRIDSLLSHIALSGDGVNLQQIATARFAPKYILNACPECGYNGDRIYTDDKGVMHCAACDAHFSLLEYCEPEWWAKVNDSLSIIDEKIESVKDFINQGALSDKNNFEEIKKLVGEGVTEEVFKKYLDECLNGQTEKLLDSDESIKRTLTAAFDKFYAQLKDINSKQKGEWDELKKTNRVEVTELKSAITNLNDENKKYNVYLAQKIDALDKQIATFYSEAMAKLDQNGEKSDLILEYVRKMCTKEYFEDVTNALGSNLKTVIASESQKGFEQVKALNESSVAQIMSHIDSLCERVEKIKKNSTDSQLIGSKLDELLRTESAMLNGQINSLQALIESDKAESREAFRTIIKSQDEIKAILLGSVGLNVNKQAFEKMYSGKIPSEMLYDEGFGGEFACPYCGAVEERRLNDDQYCRCSVCGNKFLGVNPFWKPTDPQDGKDVYDTLDMKFGRSKDDPLLASEERVKAWRKAFEAKIDGTILKMPNKKNTDEWKDTSKYLVIIPSEYDEKSHSLDDKFSNARIIIIPPNFRGFSKTFFNKFMMLETVVIMAKDKKYLWTQKEIIVNDYDVKVYGKTSEGKSVVTKLYCNH